MSTSTSVRPLVKEHSCEPASDPPTIQEELAVSSPDRESQAPFDQQKQPSRPFQKQTILFRMMASRHPNDSTQGRRVESEVVTAVLEDSFDPSSQIATRHRPSLKMQKALELPSLGDTRHSNVRCYSTHTRVSSIDSSEPLASEQVLKSQDWAAEVTLGSELNTDRFKPSLQSSARPLSPSPRPAYSIQQVANSSEARKELMALNPALHIVSMAVTAPAKYPLLDLSEEGLEDGDVWKVVRLAEVYPFATALDLYGNSLTLGTKAALPIGAEHMEIKRLSLRRCPLGKAGLGSQLGSFLRVFVGLELLDMRECGLEDSDIARIGPDLSSLSLLKVLLLSHNSITNTGVFSLLPVLERCADLSQVDLRQNRVSESAKKALGRHKGKVVLEEGRKCCSRCSLL